MNLPRALRLVLAAMIAAVLPISAVLAQSPAPAAAPTATPAPAASPTPEASPAPAPSASPVPSASPSPAPSPPPAAAQTPATPPAAKTADPFGEPVTLEAKKVATIKGKANWDAPFETVTDALKTLTTLLDKQGVKAAGNAMIVYTSTDDTGFTFIAEIPVAQDIKSPGKDIGMGQSPEGKSLKFVHRGAYDNVEDLYEAIYNHLEEKRLEAKDLFIEEYITDPLKTAEDKLVINVYVPLK
jgi:effector-binding domain-containing protein